MIEVLLYSTLSCQDARALIKKVNVHRNLPEEVKIELVDTIKESTLPLKCHFWTSRDAND